MKAVWLGVKNVVSGTCLPACFKSTSSAHRLCDVGQVTLSVPRNKDNSFHSTRLSDPHLPALVGGIGKRPKPSNFSY